MLKIAILFAGAAFALATLVPEALVTWRSAQKAARPAALASAPAAAAASQSAREQSIAADGGGQYSVDVMIDGQSTRMMVDTGATMVVISAALADKLGLSAESGRKWQVHTANGDSLATETVLPSLDLGTIYMTNVQALIADRSAGEVNLLGASFLRRLASVEQRDGVLTLRQ